MTFAAVVGVQPITLTATATATMRGSARAPYNVAVVVDSTRSMQTTDSDPVNTACKGQKEYCALLGVQTLLTETGLSPCGASQSSCIGSSMPVDEVSLFTFPAVTTASAPNEYGSNCSVTVEPYPLPPEPATGSSAPFTVSLSETSGKGTTPVTYQIVNFSYRLSDI